MALYLQSEVLLAFLTTTVMFFAMGFIGKVIKKDLSGMGRACMAGLIGIIAASVLNIFLRSGGLDFIISIVGVLYFLRTHRLGQSENPLCL